MTKVSNPINPEAGPERTNDPRHIGELTREYIQLSDSPFAQGIREFLASTEGAPDSGGETTETTGPYNNTMLCVDVKTILIIDRILKLGKKYAGVLMMDEEDHLRFEEFRKCATDGKRNWKFFLGQNINGTLRRKDDRVRLNFKEIPDIHDLNIDAFSIAVMLEVRKALFEAKGLVEEMAVTE